MAATQRKQGITLLGQFDPFGNHIQRQTLAHGDDGPNDGRVLRVHQHVTHKGLVNLELVQGQAFEHRQ